MTMIKLENTFGERAFGRSTADLAARYTGHARYLPVHRSAGPEPVSVSLVRFDPGVTTHWHRHTAGQVIYVVSGETRIQSRGKEVATVAPGETVFAEPGEEHWHGAGALEASCHVVISLGETIWGDDAEPPSG